MAEGVEDIVRTLVGRISENYSGCSLVDILSEIYRLCRSSRSLESGSIHASQSARPSPERIWRLLKGLPQISVGFDKQYNDLALADLWNDNGAALARIYHVEQTPIQSQVRVVSETLTGQSLTSTPAQPSPNPPADQVEAKTPAQLSLPGNDLTETNLVLSGIEKFIDQAAPVCDHETTPVLDRQRLPTVERPSSSVLQKHQSKTPAEEASVGRSGRVWYSSSNYATESGTFEIRSPNPSPQNSRVTYRSNRPGSPGSTGPTTLRQPIRSTRPPITTPGPQSDSLTPPKRKRGPRKYLQGTEGFWKEMFWHARNQCEGHVTPKFQAGIATHPGARALYAKRPAGIDEVILGAIEAGLPLPNDPQDITSAWRDRMAWMLRRSQHGIYISPEGVRRVDTSQYADHSDAPLSRILVLKSDRLGEVDFSEMERRPNISCPTALATDSADHHAFLSLQPTRTTGPFGPQPPPVSTEKNLSFVIRESKPDYIQRPRLGLFDHDEDDQTNLTAPSLAPGENPTTPGVQHASHDKVSWRGLPPPLTTRSRKRKFSSPMHTSERSPKPREAELVTLDKSLPPDQPVLAGGDGAQTASDAINLDIDTPDALPSLPVEPQKPRPPKARGPRSKTSVEDFKEIVKQILLEVVEECGGMIPGEYECISEYANKKFHARGKPGRLDKKICKAVIKSLCTAGRLKRLAFAFQRKSGAMATNTVLTDAEVDATSEAVKRLQENIINALPSLYVPPLGCVLDAPPISAPPVNIPPTKPAKKVSSSGKTSTQPLSTRRGTMKNGAWNDVLGPAPARNPFSWEGLPHHISMQGLEDDSSLTFVYLSTSQSNTGRAQWMNIEIESSEEDSGLVRRKTLVPEARRVTTSLTRQKLCLQDNPGTQNQTSELVWRTNKPVTSLIFDPEAFTGQTNEDIAQTDVPAVRRSLSRKTNSTLEKTATLSTVNPEVHNPSTLEEAMPRAVPRFGRSSRGRRITWKSKDSNVLPPSLPCSLQDIITMPGQIPKVDYSTTEDPDTNNFYWELDAVEYWETNILKIYQQQATNWTFINHGLTVRNSSSLGTYPDLKWDDVDVLSDTTFTTLPTYSKREQSRLLPKISEAATEHMDNEPIDSDYDPAVEDLIQEPLMSSRRRSSTQLPQQSNEPGAKTKATQRQSKRGKRKGKQPSTRQGRPRVLQTMAAEEIYHIVIAVIVVRTLAGGITSEIDWSIVQRVCPDHDEAFLQDRWNTLLIKHRQDIAKLTESMQNKFIVAYEKDEVPCVNFDDTKDSDWEAIVKWAEQKLDKNISDDIATLPSTRAELLRTTTLTFDEPQTLRDALGHTGQQLKALKEEIMANTPTAVPMKRLKNDIVPLHVEPEAGEEEDPNLCLAKSWALSTVLTPEESRNRAAVTEKLSSITPSKKEAEKLFDRAISDLQKNHVIQKHKGAPRSGGAWQVSERWYEMFGMKRMITAPILKQAAAWKRDMLDPSAENGQPVLIEKTQIMQDGAMVALINLVANERIKITAGPAGLPRGRYGLDPNATNYNTLGMSRLLTLFGTAVQPTQDYVAGDPMASSRLKIPTWEDSGRGRIPCWVDMNGALLTEIWEMVVCAVVGLLSGRPGIQVLEIERSVGHGLVGWEVETLLAWLEGSGFAQRTGSGDGWEVREWWWLVCGMT